MGFTGRISEGLYQILEPVYLEQYHGLRSQLAVFQLTGMWSGQRKLDGVCPTYTVCPLYEDALQQSLSSQRPHLEAEHTAGFFPFYASST